MKSMKSFNQKSAYIFTKVYGATIRQSAMKYSYQEYPSYAHRYDYEDFQRTATTTIKEVPAVEIIMSEKDFSELVEDVAELNDSDSEWNMFKRLNERYGDQWLIKFQNHESIRSREERLRQRVPALQKAWEHYQFTLDLVSD